jgi:hypothetical protein
VRIRFGFINKEQQMNKEQKEQVVASLNTIADTLTRLLEIVEEQRELADE